MIAVGSSRQKIRDSLQKQFNMFMNILLKIEKRAKKRAQNVRKNKGDALIKRSAVICVDLRQKKI